MSKVMMPKKVQQCLRVDFVVILLYHFWSGIGIETGILRQIKNFIIPSRWCGNGQTAHFRLRQ